MAPQFSQAPFLYLVAAGLLVSTPLLYQSEIAEYLVTFSSCCRWCVRVGPWGRCERGCKKV